MKERPNLLSIGALSGVSMEELRQIILKLRPIEHANEPVWLARLTREIISEWVRLCIARGRSASLDEKA